MSVPDVQFRHTCLHRIKNWRTPRGSKRTTTWAGKQATTGPPVWGLQRARGREGALLWLPFRQSYRGPSGSPRHRYSCRATPPPLRAWTFSIWSSWTETWSGRGFCRATSSPRPCCSVSRAGLEGRGKRKKTKSSIHTATVATGAQHHVLSGHRSRIVASARSFARRFVSWDGKASNAWRKKKFAQLLWWRLRISATVS